MDEEQEREREQEKEREKEVEIETEAEVCPPPVQAHTPLAEKQWEWGHALQKGFVSDCLNECDGCPRLHAITADELERCGMHLPQLLDFRDMPSHLFITSNWLCSVQITDDHCSPLERAHTLRAVDTFLLSPAKDQVTSIILLSGWEASNVLVEMRYLSKHAPQRATQAEEFFAQLCHLSDTGKSMCACRVGYPKLPRAEHRAVRKLFNGSCDYSLSECAEVVKFLGLLQPRSAYNFASHQWNEQQSQRLWEALRDQKVLSRNSFVKEVPDAQTSMPN